ncbi:PREDICTED: collagen alpha-1(I) chain-like, partial [Elephantulus edwardii]|uniref:collagen alpha-1(I) chain-like n=1 Tax=Elephantulus edwardii TaxID=28737 RepID=UPI0003F0C689
SGGGAGRGRARGETMAGKDRTALRAGRATGDCGGDLALLWKLVEAPSGQAGAPDGQLTGEAGGPSVPSGPSAPRVGRPCHPGIPSEAPRRADCPREQQPRTSRGAVAGSRGFQRPGDDRVGSSGPLCRPGNDRKRSRSAQPEGQSGSGSPVLEDSGMGAQCKLWGAGGCWL